MPCSLVETYSYFRRIYCPFLQGNILKMDVACSSNMYHRVPWCHISEDVNFFNPRNFKCQHYHSLIGEEWPTARHHVIMGLICFIVL